MSAQPTVSYRDWLLLPLSAKFACTHWTQHLIYQTKSFDNDLSSFLSGIGRGCDGSSLLHDDEKNHTHALLRTLLLGVSSNAH
ncbi:uncharacterized protein IAS62_002377 [Cryptococcus decagattii]|uniref:Uncharacterized protein n=1 Tax=Cryptococcus decagattii TaxID=1859122 RepID=A0ABZ2ARC3_9TREE